MSELEPDDSRNVTLRDERAPGEPPRTGPREGETRQQQQQGQSQQQAQSQGGGESNWRADEAATAGREAQDHELAGGIGGPSPRADADDGQWSQQPEQPEPAGRRLTPEEDYPLGADRPGADSENSIERGGAEPRGPRDSMAAERDDAPRRDQAERGGG